MMMMAAAFPLTPALSRLRERESSDERALSRLREREGPAQREGEGFFPC